MNEQDHAELESLETRQRQIERQIAEVADGIANLKAKLKNPVQIQEETRRKWLEESVASIASPAPLVIPTLTSIPVTLSETAKVRPPPIPISALKSTVETPAEGNPPNAVEPQSIPQRPPPTTAAAPKAKGSFEMRLGTYWLVRIGIVMLLTSLVFLGNYAYKNFIVHTGPAGKVGMLYLASAVLLGFGKWLSRKSESESVRNYAQVLFAGGLAAVYFTTYAAHYFPHLRVIESAVLDGTLLLAWAGIMVGIADRRKSEVLALFAIGLAYYTSGITQIGFFTLYSNLVLTFAVVFFLIRNRWTTLSFVSVVATYGGFVFWRFYQHDLWGWSARSTDLTTGNLFLGGYWIAFTAATFLSREGKLVNYRRAAFTSMNNGAFFALIILSMLRVNHGNLWKFSFIFGTGLLGLSLLARRMFADETATKNAYLCQGLTLVTVGIIAKFTGLELSLVLAAETLILVVLGTRLRNRWLLVASFITGMIATGGAAFGMAKTTKELILGLAVSGFLLFSSVWTRNKSEETDKDRIIPESLFFALLGLAVLFITLHANVPTYAWTGSRALLTVAFTASYYLLRNREITVVSQGYLGISILNWMLHAMDNQSTDRWWNPVIIIGCLLFLGHWWQHQKVMKGMDKPGKILQGIYAMAMMGVVFLWLQPRFSPQHWLAFTSLLAVGITAYGLATRAWFLASCGQLFLWVSCWEFAHQLLTIEPTWLTALTPIMTLIGTAMAVSAWLEIAGKSTHEVNQAVNSVSMLYRLAAFLMSLWWIFKYIPESDQAWVCTLVAIILFVLSGWWKNQQALFFSTAFLGTGWLTLIMLLLDKPAFAIYWPNLLSILVIPAVQTLARRRPEHFRIPGFASTLVTVVNVLILWLYLTRWITIASGGHFFLTASWAGLALIVFAAGFILRERTYRWLGLVILAAALGRVIVFDVWKLETLYRILSFMALGVALLVLGFVYNKYQEKIKEWL